MSGIIQTNYGVCKHVEDTPSTQVQAIQLTEENVEKVIEFCEGKLKSHPLVGVVIETNDGSFLLKKGDWITKEVKVEFSAWSKESFEDFYTIRGNPVVIVE